MRRCYGNDFLALKAIDTIAVSRKDSKDGFLNNTTVPQPLSMRRVTIIDSLKHPDEAKLFRQVYGGVYWQFTVFAPEHIRENRLKNLNIDKSDIFDIFSSDEDDPSGPGQKINKTAYLSDFFVRNDSKSKGKIVPVLNRFLDIIFNVEVATPTVDEAGMFAAVSASLKSACLSRQVGAAIYSNKNELISVGWNDVPKHGGGLYVTDNDDDNRCFKWGVQCCHNDLKKDYLYQNIHNELKKSEFFKEQTPEKDIVEAIKKTKVKNLIEFSRSIHAEMEAIVAAARSGKSGLIGATLYTTTYPWHNCARHIVAAGIKTVYYVEPYAKSLAIELREDSISNEKDPKKVEFIQYEGVAPRVMSKLFAHTLERKSSGIAIKNNRKVAKPVHTPPLDGFRTHEERVTDRFNKMAEQNESPIQGRG